MNKIEFSYPSFNYAELKNKKPEDVAKEFEAIFLKEILKVAFKELTKDKDFTARTYYDLFIENVSENLASAGGVGIAKFILENLKNS